MGSSFKLLCLPAFKPFVVIYCFSLESLYFSLQTPFLVVIVVLLGLGPVQDAFSLLLVMSKLGLFGLFMLVSLRVLHLKLRHIVSCLVFIRLQV